MVVFEIRVDWYRKVTLEVFKDTEDWTFFKVDYAKNHQKTVKVHPTRQLYSAVLEALETSLLYDSVEESCRGIAKSFFGLMLAVKTPSDISAVLYFIEMSLALSYEPRCGAKADWETIRSFIDDWSNPIKYFTVLKTRSFALPLFKINPLLRIPPSGSVMSSDRTDS